MANCRLHEVVREQYLKYSSVLRHPCKYLNDFPISTMGISSLFTKSFGINCFEVEPDFGIPNDLRLST